MIKNDLPYGEIWVYTYTYVLMYRFGDLDAPIVNENNIDK